MVLVVVGISGHKRAGKDTFGALLIKELNKISGVSAQRLALADSLKEMAITYFNWDGQKSQDKRVVGVKDFPDTQLIGGRTLLQGLGVCMRERVDTEYWVKQLDEDIRRSVGESGEDVEVFVVTDIRFANEARYIKSKEGFLFKVVRDGYIGDSHVSETEMDSPPFMEFQPEIIENNDTLEDLGNVAEMIAKEIISKY